jgi:hypothetical protein
MRKLQIPLVLLASTGTIATALIRKGFQAFESGTCSGTQPEQALLGIGVPGVQVEQEHNRNAVTHCGISIFFQCSGVPVVNAIFGRHFPSQEFEGSPQ